jgi:His-Xaa-Ser system protein HxsD
VPDIIVEFGASQSIGALREAAYRLIGEASCLIDTVDARHSCRLTPKKALAGDADEALRARFLDLVTDENLREKVAAETAGVRDVILALAFGALAREREDSVSS